MKNSSAAIVAEVDEEVEGEGEATPGVDVVMIVTEVALVAGVAGLALHPAIVTVVTGEIEETAEVFVGV